MAATSAADVERELASLVERDRKRHGAPGAAHDRALDAVARAHSVEMRDRGMVSHVSRRTGTALDRLRRAGVRPELALENVGRAYSAQEIEEGFLGSPGHRGNLLSAEARRFGVGVALGRWVGGRREVYATQLFVR
jgi:uncharacterized protein YkwD